MSGTFGPNMFAIELFFRTCSQELFQELFSGTVPGNLLSWPSMLKDIQFDDLGHKTIQCEQILVKKYSSKLFFLMEIYDEMPYIFFLLCTRSLFMVIILSISKLRNRPDHTSLCFVCQNVHVFFYISFRHIFWGVFLVCLWNAALQQFFQLSDTVIRK